MLKIGRPIRIACQAALLAAGAAFLSAPMAAQVSLATVVDLAQRNSTPVRIAQADMDKARAAGDTEASRNRTACIS